DRHGPNRRQRSRPGSRGGGVRLRQAEREARLPTVKGTRELITMRIQGRTVVWPDRMISPWVTRGRAVPTTAGRGPAVWAVRPRRMRPIASRRTVHTGVVRIVATVPHLPPARVGPPGRTTGTALVGRAAGPWRGKRSLIWCARGTAAHVVRVGGWF